MKDTQIKNPNVNMTPQDIKEVEKKLDKLSDAFLQALTDNQENQY